MTIIIAIMRVACESELTLLPLILLLLLLLLASRRLVTAEVANNTAVSLLGEIVIAHALCLVHYSAALGSQHHPCR